MWLIEKLYFIRYAVCTAVCQWNRKEQKTKIENCGQQILWCVGWRAPTTDSLNQKKQLCLYGCYLVEWYKKIVRRFHWTNIPTQFSLAQARLLIWRWSRTIWYRSIILHDVSLPIENLLMWFSYVPSWLDVSCIKNLL